MKSVLRIAVLGIAVAGGAAIGYKIATDEVWRSRLMRNARDVFHTSKQRVDEMTEEVAVKTAKMTKNPKINQQFVEQQWEHIGL